MACTEGSRQLILCLVRPMRRRVGYITAVLAVVAHTLAAQTPSDLIRITSMTLGAGDGPKTIGGYATVPPSARPELCHLSLNGTANAVLWFGEAGSPRIRFEVTLTADQLRTAVLKLSDRPLQVRSVEELEQRPGSTYAELRVDDVKIPGN